MGGSNVLVKSLGLEKKLRIQFHGEGFWVQCLAPTVYFMIWSFRNKVCQRVLNTTDCSTTTRIINHETETVMYIYKYKYIHICP